jgi:hypothetical protein
MVGQEIKGNVWDQSLGLDLQPPSVRVGFRTLSPTSVQNLKSRDSRLTKLALDKALRHDRAQAHASRPMYQKRMFYSRYYLTEFGMGY